MENPTIKSQEAMKNRHLTIPPHQAEGIDLPSGGLTGQALIKKSDADDDVTWGSVQAPLPEGTEGQVLRQGSSGLEFASVGSAAYKDYTTNVQPDNHNLVESNAVYAAISSAISAVYEPHGDITCAELTSDLLISENVGNLYTVSDSGTTSNLFIQGAGKTINAGDSVAIIVAGPNVYKFNLMPGIVDLSSLQTKALSPAISVDGVNQATVVDCLTALATAFANKTLYFDSSSRTTDARADAETATVPKVLIGSGAAYTGNLPNGNFAYGVFLVLPRGGDKHLFAFFGGFEIASCKYVNGSWGDWSMQVTPDPYNSNEQYTGKKWVDGRDIYYKRINLGALNNASEKHVNHGISNFGYCVGFRGVAIAESASAHPTLTLPYIGTNGDNGINVYIDNTKIAVKSVSDYSAYTGYAEIEYVKSTT